jgi:hypothetical protein
MKKERLSLRIVPSELAGYAPGKYVVQYKSKSAGGVWFDVGEPRSKKQAEARLRSLRQ